MKRTPFSIATIIIGLIGFITLSSCSNDDETVTVEKIITKTDTLIVTQTDTVEIELNSVNMVALGEKIFFDENLSTPSGLACASCHSPEAGFADPRGTAVSEGALDGIFGNRNAPSAAYASYVPALQYVDNGEGEDEFDYVGGLFWDGRTNSLELQAKFPIRNHLEQNEATDEVVVEAIKNSAYAADFYELFGDDALDEVSTGFDHIATAIATYERSALVNKFSSKFDKVSKGEATFTAEELLGQELFNDPEKANCAACHITEPNFDGGPVLFTDFTYDNIGIPKNFESPFLDLPAEENPDGRDFIDYGLKATTNRDSDEGRFRVPTLRNVEKTAPYGHNGFFETLEDIVHFYNVKNSGLEYPDPEIPETENKEEIGELGLTTTEELAIVAFMKTLTDE